MKTCTRCKVDKTLDAYNKNKRYDDGYFCYCKDCMKDTQYLRRYGISKVEVEQMIKDQDGLCALCHNSMEKPRVDHDHATGKVRGILCNHCNVGLGHFFDNTKYLQNAIHYLNK
jgi:hypothetical protein